MLFHAKIVVKINPAKLEGLSQSMSAISKLTGILVLSLTKKYLLLLFSRILFSIYLLPKCFSNFDELFKISIVNPCDQNATLPARDMSTRKAKSLQLVSGIYIKTGRHGL